MGQTDRTGSSEKEADRLWSLMEKFHVCMLTTMDGAAHRARPMGSNVRRAENAIYLLTEHGSPKEQDIEDNPNVNVSFSDPGGNDYVSVSGQARILNDRALIRDLWSPAAEAFWDGADDPKIRVIEILPSEAQYWQGPNKLIATAVMLTAAVTGSKPADLGKTAKVDLQ
ncbi:MAG: pyridoxamine 5'-phosphate oxidase family protein [Hyphomonadaceae bacterium]